MPRRKSNHPHPTSTYRSSSAVRHPSTSTTSSSSVTHPQPPTSTHLNSSSSAERYRNMAIPPGVRIVTEWLLPSQRDPVRWGATMWRGPILVLSSSCNWLMHNGRLHRATKCVTPLVIVIYDERPLYMESLDDQVPVQVSNLKCIGVYHPTWFGDDFQNDQPVILHHLEDGPGPLYETEVISVVKPNEAELATGHRLPPERWEDLPLYWFARAPELTLWGSQLECVIRSDNDPIWEPKLLDNEIDLKGAWNLLDTTMFMWPANCDRCLDTRHGLVQNVPDLEDFNCFPVIMYVFWASVSVNREKYDVELETCQVCKRDRALFSPASLFSTHGNILKDTTPIRIALDGDRAFYDDDNSD